MGSSKKPATGPFHEVTQYSSATVHSAGHIVIVVAVFIIIIIIIIIINHLYAFNQHTN